MIIQLIVLIMKWLSRNQMVRSNPMLYKEEFLPEKFTLSAKSYEQIKRTAMGIPVIALAIFTLIAISATLVMLMVANLSINKGIDFTVGEVMAIIQYILQIMIPEIIITAVTIALIININPIRTRIILEGKQ